MPRKKISQDLSDDGALRDRMLAVMVTQREYEMIEQAAFKDGRAVSSWVRQLILPKLDDATFDIGWALEKRRRGEGK